MKLVLIASLLGYVTAEWLQQRAPTQFELNNIYQDFALELVQQNLDKLHEISESVENPTSKDFGKFLTIAEVANIVGQPANVISEIEERLQSSCGDVCKINIKVGAHRDYITVNTCLARIQCMFNVEMVQYQNPKTNKIVFRSNKRSMDVDSMNEFLRTYIENIGMIWNFPEEIRRVGKSNEKLDDEQLGVGIYPATVAKNYGMDKYTSIISTGPQSSQAVVEFNDCYWKSSDVLEFQKLYNLPINNVTQIIGEYKEPRFDKCGEAVLDIEWITGVSNLETWAFMSNDWMPYFQTIASTESAPLVHSMSYGSSEKQELKERLNTELEKLTLSGFTFFGASGDDGTNGNGGYDTSDRVHSSFPSFSRYVTAVGATYLQSNDSDIPQCTINWSGSGFSYAFSRPPWQDKAVETYLSSGVPLPNKNEYNANGRAFTDVTAYGTNIWIVQNGRSWPSGGTSASTPIFAAMVAYANAMREQAGKGPLGNINPRLYAAENIGTDVTCGASTMTSRQCGPPVPGPAFNATSGWDPASGLGAPIAPVLFDILMA